MEETGWQVTISGFLGFSTHFAPSNGVTYYRMSFVAQPVGFDTQAVIDPDIDLSQWMTLDEIRAQQQQLRSPMVLSCIEDYLAGRIFPLDIFRNSL